MPTVLTPDALSELRELLWNGRRFISEIYRESTAQLSEVEIAASHGFDDPRKVIEALEALKILFGRKSLPKSGNGRQSAINEANSWLNSNLALSTELEEHFREILIKANRTNQRKMEGYDPPLPPKHRNVYSESYAKDKEGDESAIYVITRQTFKEIAELKNEPMILKIGWSNKVWDRIANAQTWDPDPVVVLRIFPCRNPNTIEAKIHICLDTLGLSYEKGGGREWFKTELSLIDEIADSLGLKNDYENE